MAVMAGGALALVQVGERVKGGAFSAAGQRISSSTSFGARAGRARMGAGPRPVCMSMNGSNNAVGAAKGLNEAINGLFQTFKEREGAARPQRWKTMEFRQTAQDGVFFEVFCNPNAYSNAFQAKVLITINDEKIKIASEGQLSALKADIDEYVAQHI